MFLCLFLCGDFYMFNKGDSVEEIELFGFFYSKAQFELEKYFCLHSQDLSKVPDSTSTVAESGHVTGPLKTSESETAAYKEQRESDKP